MPYDPSQKIRGYSLTDFHDFDECPFRFYVRHDLDKKYELDEGGPQVALGNLLDQSIKLFHEKKLYGSSVERAANLVDDAKESIIDYEMHRKRPNFYTTTVPFLDEVVVNRAREIFVNYYKAIDGKINKGKRLDFCKREIHCQNGTYWIWGGADTLELAPDGMVEVVDYKSRENISRGKETIDMDLMPKIYVLLCADRLLQKGNKKARFRAKFWQDPKEDNFFEEFDLESLKTLDDIFDKKICDILDNKDVSFCNGRFCKACNSPKRAEFVSDLKNLGLQVITEDTFLLTNLEAGASPLVIESDES
jgi:hypothetical protein